MIGLKRDPFASRMTARKAGYERKGRNYEFCGYVQKQHFRGF